MDTFINRLKKAMEIRGMRQADLCEKTDIPRSALSNYLNGNYEPRQDRVGVMAEALNVDEAWLMGFDVPMARKTPEENEMAFLIQELKDRPEKKTLLNLLDGATTEDVEQIIKIVEALKR